MTIILRRVGFAGALVGCLLTAGCSSSGGGKGSSTSGAPPAGQSESSPIGALPSDPATTQSATTAFEMFFNSKTSPVNSQKFLQHGAEFAKSLEKQATASYSKDTVAKVSSVQPIRKGVAAVTYSLVSKGTPLLPNVGGFAVLENGTWKVSAQTYCNLLKLQGDVAPACSDKTITALPA
jgi:hypothetical protein